MTVTVLDRLRLHGQAGIPFDDARTILLTLWVTLDILPPELRGEVLDREQLAEIFAILAREGVIAWGDDSPARVERWRSPASWRRLPDSILRGGRLLDGSGYERARRYFAPP